MGVSEGSRTSERTSGDDGAHPGRRRAASHNRPRTAAPKKLLLVDVIATSSDLQQDPPIATTVRVFCLNAPLLGAHQGAAVMSLRARGKLSGSHGTRARKSTSYVRF